jgi:hypothetical protein
MTSGWHSVEGIAVMERQRLDLPDVVDANRQQL